MIKPQLMIVSMLMMTYVITSSPSQYVEFHSNHEEPNNIGYAFRYYIDERSENGVSLDHWESKRAIDGVVTGGYGVRDANGITRTVYYRVDGDKGFEAIIKTVSPGGLFYFQQQFQNNNDDNHLRLKQPSSPLQHAKPISSLSY